VFFSPSGDSHAATSLVVTHSLGKSYDFIKGCTSWVESAFNSSICWDRTSSDDDDLESRSGKI